MAFESLPSGNLGPVKCEEIFKEKVISDYHFNSSLSIVIPGLIRSDEFSQKIVFDSEYYRLLNVPLYYFIDAEFIQHFIKSGGVTAVSIGTDLFHENCCSISPNGHMLLSVDTNTFQELGLQNGPAISITNRNSIFSIDINLKHQCFHPEKKNYKRAYKNLKSSSICFNMEIAWEPTDETICPSSLGNFFSLKGVKVFEVSLSEDSKTYYDIYIPKKSQNLSLMDEWFGVIPLDAFSFTKDAGSKFAHDYWQASGSVAYYRWSGLITRGRILKLFNYLRSVLQESSSTPYICLNIGYNENAPTRKNSMRRTELPRGSRCFLKIDRRDRLNFFRVP